MSLKDPSTVGYLQRWYGYCNNGWTIWTPVQEPRRGADFAVVVETRTRDDVTVRAALMDRYSNEAVCLDWAVIDNG
jgi:hypothetical protein